AHAVDVQPDVEIEEPREDQSREQFDQKITDRERGLAGAAATAQDPVADERDIIVPAYALEAVSAVRPRPEEAFLVGDAMNADVEQATDGGTHRESEPDPDEEDRLHARFNSSRRFPTSTLRW